MSERAATLLTELGMERLCRRCGEWWPVDASFWYFDRKGNVMGRCRACWSERNRSHHQRRKESAA